MAKKAAPANLRGSPEAIAKRREARAFNDLLDPSGRSKLDGRTDKRRQRLLAELEAGKTRGSGRALKPLDVLAHVTELLSLGETVASIRKVYRPRPSPSEDPALIEALQRLHAAYGFPKEAYGFLGIRDDVLKRAKIGGRSVKRRRSAASRPEPGAAKAKPARSRRQR